MDKIKAVETLAAKLYKHHKKDISRSRSGRSWLIFGYYPVNWKGLQDVLELHSSPVKINIDEDSFAQQHGGLIRLRSCIKEML